RVPALLPDGAHGLVLVRRALVGAGALPERLAECRRQQPGSGRRNAARLDERPRDAGFQHVRRTGVAWRRLSLAALRRSDRRREGDFVALAGRTGDLGREDRPEGAAVWHAAGLYARIALHQRAALGLRAAD